MGTGGPKLAAKDKKYKKYLIFFQHSIKKSHFLYVLNERVGKNAPAQLLTGFRLYSEKMKE